MEFRKITAFILQNTLLIQKKSGGIDPDTKQHIRNDRSTERQMRHSCHEYIKITEVQCYARI